MKILINTVSREDIINKAEEAAKPVLVKGKEAIDQDSVDFASSLSCPTIGDRIFPLEQWVHVDEKWVADNAATLGLYPDIKEATVVREEKLARARSDYGIDNIDLALKQAADLYGVGYVIPEEVVAAAVKVEATIAAVKAEVELCLRMNLSPGG